MVEHDAAIPPHEVLTMAVVFVEPLVVDVAPVVVASHPQVELVELSVG